MVYTPTYTPKGYCTIKQIENYLLIDIEESFEPQVEEWIAQIEKHIERETGRIFIADEDASERIYDGDGKQELFLDESVEVSKVTIDSVEVLIANYLKYPASELPITRIKLTDSSMLYFTKDEQNIKVEAKWGSFVECPADISFATIVFVAGIINFSGIMEGEIKSETIGSYSVTYKEAKDWQDFERAKEILKSYKKTII